MTVLVSPLPPPHFPEDIIGRSPSPPRRVGFVPQLEDQAVDLGRHRLIGVAPERGDCFFDPLHHGVT